MKSFILFVVIKCGGVTGEALVRFPTESQCMYYRKQLSGNLCVKVSRCRRG